MRFAPPQRIGQAIAAPTPCVFRCHSAEISGVPHRLNKLGPQHHAAIRMRIEGVPTEEICDRLDVEKRTVYLWFSDPLVKAELVVQLQLVNAAFAERLATAGLVAFEQLRALAEAPVQGPVSPELKLEVLRDILDRIAAHPTLSGPPPNPFEGMSTSAIVEHVQRYVEGGGLELAPPNGNGADATQGPLSADKGEAQTRNGA